MAQKTTFGYGFFNEFFISSLEKIEIGYICLYSFKKRINTTQVSARWE